MTPAQRRLSNTAAAEKRWAMTADPVAATKPGRDAFLAKFEAQVDPDGVMPPEERRRRAVKLRRAHMLKLAAASAAARARRKAAS